MLTLYTAVGTLKFQKTTGGKSIPLVINDGQEYGLSDDELLLWSCLAFQILTLHELQDAYTLRQIQKEGPKGLSFQHYLNRLSLRGLVVSGIGLTGVDALYRLLGSLTIIPLKDTFPIRLFGCVQLYLEGTIGAKEFGRYLKKKYPKTVWYLRPATVFTVSATPVFRWSWRRCVLDKNGRTGELPFGAPLHLKEEPGTCASGSAEDTV